MAMTANRRRFLSGSALGIAGLAIGANRPALAAADDTLIIVYSRTGSTAQLAGFIAEKTGASILRIDAREPYASSYSAMTDIARNEKRRGLRREIATPIPDLSRYKTVFIGSPYWWGGLAVPMWTLLSDHPMAGKRVIPFITSGSSSPHGTLDEMRTLMPNAKIDQYFYTPGDSASSARKEVNAWLTELGF